MTLNTRLSTLVTDWCPPNLAILTFSTETQYDLFPWWVVWMVEYQRWWVIQMTHDVLDPSLLPPMDACHMHIKITYPGEGMVGHQTPSDTTKIWTFLVRVSSTIWLVLTLCLFDLKAFVTKWAYKSAWRHHRIGPMLGLVVLVHGLSTSKLFATYRACDSFTSHT